MARTKFKMFYLIKIQRPSPLGLISPIVSTFQLNQEFFSLSLLSLCSLRFRHGPFHPVFIRLHKLIYDLLVLGCFKQLFIFLRDDTISGGEPAQLSSSINFRRHVFYSNALSSFSLPLILQVLLISPYEAIAVMASRASRDLSRSVQVNKSVRLCEG